MYVNEVEEGQFDLSGEAFFKNTEKSQLRISKTVSKTPVKKPVLFMEDL